jgi:subtilase family serine protease
MRRGSTTRTSVKERRPLGALLGSMGVAVGLLATVGVAGAGAATAPAGRAAVQSASHGAVASNEVGVTPASASIDFEVGLAPRDRAGAQALEQAVSDPGSASYRHYLTAAQWESRFSPTSASVDAVTAWLRSEDLAVGGVTPDRLTVQATGTAAQIESAFGTGLAEYRVNGQVLRLASSAVTVPATLAGLVDGVSGVDEIPATHPSLTDGPTATAGAASPGTAIPPPVGFRNAKPCSTSYGQTSDTTDPAYGGGYPSPLPYAVCGYTPAQLQGAYNLAKPIAAGTDGKGVTVAIVDAYASPTLYADAHTYSVKNQPDAVLKPSQYSEVVPSSFNNTTLCQASGWFGEQTLDVEAVHAMAPGAHILYVGAKNCINGLFDAVQNVVDHGAAQIITDSWGDTAGDLLDPSGVRTMFDNVLLLAGGTGIGVQFSSGDEGDNFSVTGLTAADYPAESPYATAVGGTSLEVNSGNARTDEVGWSTSKSVLCTTLLVTDGYPGCTTAVVGTWLPASPGGYDYGAGGGVSYNYAEPYYQHPVVPTALAEANALVTGVLNRVEPDISMDADPTTGMLIGETQAFPDGVYYDQYRIGGTSLASPLLAGLLADADQAAGSSLGFVNPALYKVDTTASAATAFYDVVPGHPQANVRVDYVNGVDAKEGTLTSVRTFTFEGNETYCSAAGVCKSQQLSQAVGKGYDSMTGIGSAGPDLVSILANR